MALERSQQQPIPNETYNIFDINADKKHNGLFKLVKQDFEPYNDKADVSDRDGFRFHLGTETVSEKRGSQVWDPFYWLANFGILTLIVEVIIKEK